MEPVQARAAAARFAEVAEADQLRWAAWAGLAMLRPDHDAHFSWRHNYVDREPRRAFPESTPPARHMTDTDTARLLALLAPWLENLGVAFRGETLCLLDCPGGELSWMEKGMQVPVTDDVGVALRVLGYADADADAILRAAADYSARKHVRTAGFLRGSRGGAAGGAAGDDTMRLLCSSRFFCPGALLELGFKHGPSVLGAFVRREWPSQFERATQPQVDALRAVMRERVIAHVPSVAVPLAAAAEQRRRLDAVVAATIKTFTSCEPAGKAWDLFCLLHGLLPLADAVDDDGGEGGGGGAARVSALWEAFRAERGARGVDPHDRGGDPHDFKYHDWACLLSLSPPRFSRPPKILNNP
jgi:hypothetical protein